MFQVKGRPRTVAAVVFGLALMAGMVVSLIGQTPPAPRAVRVTAERFSFTPSEITVAPGAEIEFHLRSEDTAHGFRILGHQVDIAIPKRGRGEAIVRFVAPGPGKYTFECSRMCGAGHSFMRGTLIVKADAKGVR